MIDIGRLIIDKNAVYEIDEECEKRQRRNKDNTDNEYNKSERNISTKKDGSN